MQIKNILTWSIIVGIFAMPLIPFIVSSSMFFPYITGKNFTFRIIVEIIFSLWIVLALYDAQYRPRFTWLNVVLAAFLIVIGIADIFGLNFFQSFWSNFERMEGYITLLHLAAYFLVASTVLNTEKLWDALWMVSLGCATVMSLIGISAILGSLGDLSAAPRIDATLGNPIYLAIYNVFHIFIALYLWAKQNRWQSWHVVYPVIIALQSLALLFSLTRGAVVGLVGGLIVTAILVALFEKKRLALRKSAFVTLGTLIVVIGGFLAIKDTEFAQTTPVLSRFATISLEGGGTIAARYMIWNIALQGFWERPILGWGQNNFDFVFAKYYTPNMYGQEPWFDRTHNIFFDWLIAGGILGLMAYLAIPLVALYYIWLYRREEQLMTVTEKSLWTGLLAAYMFHNLFVFDHLVSYLLYMTVLAFIAWRVTSGLPHKTSRTISEKNMQFVALPAGIAVAIALVWSLNAPSIQASQTLIKALSQQSGGPEKNLEYFKQALENKTIGRQEIREQVLQAANQVAGAQGVPDTLKTQFFVIGRDEMNAELERNPNSARLELFYAAFLSRFGQSDLAMQHFEKARQLSPKKQVILFQVGDMYLRQGKNAEALAMFKQAYELEPNYEEARKLYALAALYAGQGTVADTVLKEKYGTTVVEDPRFISAYTQAKRYNDVIRILDSMIKKDPANPQYQVQLAAAYFEAGQRDRAIETLQKLIQAQPKYKEQLEGFINDISAGRRPGQQ